MFLARLVCVKHIVYAVAVLVFLLCAAEVGLRLQSLRTDRAASGNAAGEGLLIASWQMHHRLRPLAEIRAANPDTGEPVEIRTNSHGLRGSEIVVPKPVGVYRIICLGDERVLAAGTQRSSTFCDRLRVLLQRRTRFDVEVINAGVPDYCPLLSYLQVKHALLALQPDLLILNFDMSDIADDQRYRRHTQMSAEGVPLACSHTEFRSRNEPIVQRIDDQFLTVKWSKSLLSRLTGGSSETDDAHDIHARRGRYAWLNDNPPDWDAYIQQGLSPIDHLMAISGQAFIGFVVAAYPAPWQVSASASCGGGVRENAGIADDALFQSRRPFEQIAEYLRQRHIPFCDTSPAFRNAEDPEKLYLCNAAEFSAKGHLLYARELEQFLVEHAPGVWSETPPESLPSAVIRNATSPRATNRLR